MYWELYSSLIMLLEGSLSRRTLDDPLPLLFRSLYCPIPLEGERDLRLVSNYDRVMGGLSSVSRLCDMKDDEMPMA